MKPIISVEQLGKAYHLGRKVDKNATLRDAVVDFGRHAATRFRQRFSEPAEGGADAFWAVRDASFSVNRGEVMGLVGRNGAGKSTLLKMLSRITEPTEGRAVLRGRVASLLEVGTGFHPELTGRENIYLNGAILGMRRTEIARKFDAIVDFAGVEKFLDTPVKRYSSGMYVRLAFAVAAHLDPEILIVDEVLAVGDAEFQKKCLGKMGDVVRQGRTVLFVSHNMDAVSALCTHVVVVNAGKVSERLSPDEGIKQYLALANEGSDLPLAQKPRAIGADRAAPIFTGLRITTDSGHDKVVETHGRVELEIEIRDCDDLADATCGVAIANSRGQRVAFFHTLYQSGLRFRGTKEPQTLRCTIPSLPLVPASYYVELVISNEDKPIEKVERADRLDVVFRDVFGTGKVPNPSQGVVVLPCEWTPPADSGAAAVVRS
jgi:lipopolysaccharide transport system ATP-binding protein